jgi:hypothetical protein
MFRMGRSEHGASQARDHSASRKTCTRVFPIIKGILSGFEEGRVLCERAQSLSRLAEKDMKMLYLAQLSGFLLPDSTFPRHSPFDFGRGTP